MRGNMKILNYGSMNIDKVYQVEHFVRPGETIATLGYDCFPGGKGLNQSVAAAQAGQRVYHAGCVGTDGDFLIDILEKSGADTGYIKRIDGVTGHALIQVSRTGENCILLFAGSNAQNDRDSIDAVLDNFEAGDILMLQNEINNLEYLLTRGSQKGMRIMLNPSPMDENLKKMDLSGITWLILNETEGLELTGRQKLSDGQRMTEKMQEEILNDLLSAYPDLKVVLTLGGDGSVYRSAQETCRQPIFKVKAVDTTAAGDTFTGYFAAAMVEELPVADALELAACAAAMAVAKAGASVSIPARAEVEKQLAVWKG